MTKRSRTIEVTIKEGRKVIKIRLRNYEITVEGDRSITGPVAENVDSFGRLLAGPEEIHIQIDGTLVRPSPRRKSKL